MRTILALYVILTCVAWGQDNETAPGRLRIPNRPTKSLFEGEQGRQKGEIYFDKSSGTVTLKFLVQDAHGYFIPWLRRENFVVYENDVRQTNASVEIEHAPVSLALLMEYGGRHAAMNRYLLNEVSTDGHELVEILGKDDKLALWPYGDKVTELSAFSSAKDNLDTTMLRLQPPDVSETNLYDAVIFAENRIRPVAGRTAIVLISSGVDTFSKATYEDAVRASRSGTAPIYAVGIGDALRNAAILDGSARLVSGIDWKTAQKNLGEIARASGGRLYLPSSSIDLPAMYDDMMENLKVRYVITYKSSVSADTNTLRTVRVDLVNTKTGKPLEIVDTDGHPVRPTIIVRHAYTQSGAGQPN